MARSGPKGWRGEDNLRRWATENGWPAERIKKTSQDRDGLPDVEVDFYGVKMLAESKNDKRLPSKGVLEAVAQSESYCHGGEIPLLMMHVHGTSNDIIAIEKDHFARIVHHAYQAGARSGSGVTFHPFAAVASVQAEGLAHRIV